MPVIEFENLTKIYRLPSLFKARRIVGIEALNFSIDGGEIFGLLGLNGSGKTTTLRLLLGLIRPTSGRVRVLGSDARSDRTLRSHLGYLPENLNFSSVLTAREILRFFAKIDGQKFQNSGDIEKRISEVLDIVGLATAGARPIAAFSKGMVQRLGIGQAILHEPQILVLDEPAGGLDPLGIVQMRELFLRLNQEFKITILFSSHSIGEVEKISHRVAVIADNRLKAIIARTAWEGGAQAPLPDYQSERPLFGQQSPSGTKPLEKHFLECIQG